MSKNNYMGKIDEDSSGTTIPNYDSKCQHLNDYDTLSNKYKSIGIDNLNKLTKYDSNGYLIREEQSCSDCGICQPCNNEDCHCKECETCLHCGNLLGEHNCSHY